MATNNNIISTCYLDLLVFQRLFQMWHKISWVPHIRGYVDGVGGGLRLPFRHNGTICCAKWAINGTQTTLKGKADLPITAMDDWEQTHTNATLLKPAKHCYSVFRALQGHAKAVWKSIPGYLLLFYCGVWIVHKWSYKVSQ